MKAIRALSLLLLLSVILGACGGATPAAPTAAPAGSAAPTAAPADAAAPTAAPAAVSPEGRTLVRFWYGLGGQIGEVIKTQIDKYNASQDKVFVEGVFQQSYNGVQEKFQAALVSGDVPEIVQIEIHGTPKFASAGALTPLEEFWANDPSFNFDDLVPAGLLNQRWNGQIYAMPINRSTPVLYYNKKLFREAGLDPEKPPTTWQEFREVAKKLTKVENGETTTHGYLAGTSWWYFESMVWSNNGEIMNKDLSKVTFAEPGAAPLQIWTDMIHIDKTARFFTGDKAFDQTLDVFGEGRGAMMFQSTASLGAVRRVLESKNNGLVELGTAFVPHMEGYSTAVPTGGAAAGIPAKVSPEKKQAAWDFIKWWISTEQNAFWSANTGYWPVRKSSIAQLEAEGYYEQNPYFYTTIRQLEFAREAPLTPFWPAISKEINTAMDETMLNNVPALEALKKAEERAQQAIEE